MNAGDDWNMNYEEAANYWINKDEDSKAKKMEPNELIVSIEKFIQAHNTCALATGTDCFVRCTPIEYSYLHESLYLFSEGGLKFRALRDNKNVCLAIYDSYTGFGKLGGMQIMGVAELIQPFCEEYNELLIYKKIPLAAMQKLPRPMNLIKVIPHEIDYLNSELKDAGYDSRQHISF